MDINETIAPSSISNNKFHNALKSLSQLKIDYVRDKEECKKLKEINAKLELELKEVRDLEKSHRFHLLSTREMIGNLQETVSQLVYLKRDTKKLKDDIQSRDSSIAVIEKERENLLRQHREILMEVKNAHERQVEEISVINEKRVQQAQHDADTQVAQYKCIAEELRAKIKEMEIEHRNKINVMALEYEEKLQRSNAQVVQLREQHAGLMTRTDANIDAYRRRLEDVEEKLKQSQFKHYLAQSSKSSIYDTPSQQVERPYSVNRDPYPENVIHNESLDNSKRKLLPMTSQNKGATRGVNYFSNNKSSDKKGPFNIVKKRKLYNENDFQNT